MNKLSTIIIDVGHCHRCITIGVNSIPLRTPCSSVMKKKKKTRTGRRLLLFAYFSVENQISTSEEAQNCSTAIFNIEIFLGEPIPHTNPPPPRPTKAGHPPPPLCSPPTRTYVARDRLGRSCTP